jgi:hypothetical protein
VPGITIPVRKDMAPVAPIVQTASRPEKKLESALSHPTIERPMPIGRRPPTLRSRTLTSVSPEEDSVDTSVADKLRAELESLKAELQKRDIALVEMKTANANQMASKDSEIKKLKEGIEEEKERNKVKSISNLRNWYSPFPISCNKSKKNGLPQRIKKMNWRRPLQPSRNRQSQQSIHKIKNCFDSKHNYKKRNFRAENMKNLKLH